MIIEKIQDSNFYKIITSKMVKDTAGNDVEIVDREITIAKASLEDEKVRLAQATLDNTARIAEIDSWLAQME